MAPENIQEKKEKEPTQKVDEHTTAKSVDLGPVMPDKGVLTARITAETSAIAEFTDALRKALKLPVVVAEGAKSVQDALLLEYWKEFKDDLTTEYIGRKDIERERVRLDIKAQEAQEPASPQQLSFLRSLATEGGKESADLANSMLEKLKKQTKDLTKAEASDMITALKELKGKGGGFRRGDDYR